MEPSILDAEMIGHVQAAVQWVSRAGKPLAMLAMLGSFILAPPEAARSASTDAGIRLQLHGNGHDNLNLGSIRLGLEADRNPRCRPGNDKTRARWRATPQ